jgi:membrane protein
LLLIRSMFLYFEKELSWMELARRTVKDSIQDDVAGIAAQLSYYFFLSLFPALLFLVALASFFPLYNFTDELMRMVGPIAPAAVVELLKEQLTSLSNSGDTGLLSIGLLMALWSSSAAMVSVIDAMNRAYDIEDSRTWVKRRVIAIALTIGLALFILTSFGLIVAGPWLADFLGQRFGLAGAFTMTWKILQWPVVFLLASTGFGLVYYFAPDAEQEWVWITPGALTATILWFLTSLAFRYYVVNFGNYEEAYGTLGAIILTLLWFYISGLAMVIGAELNAEIHRASPWGKNPGPKIMGQRKRLGLAASREWFKQHAKESGPATSPA